MRKVNAPDAIIVLIVATCISLGGCNHSGQANSNALGKETRAKPQTKQVTTVRSRDIPEKVQILGVLGRPLGSFVKIRGKWAEPGLSKFSGLLFRVTTVNGQEPGEKIVFIQDGTIRQIYPNENGRAPKPGEAWDWKYDLGESVPSPKPKEGDTWEMLGVEIGCWEHCYSDEVCNEIRSYLYQKASYEKPFYTCFEYVAVKIVK